jgi:hypothetical protein
MFGEYIVSHKAEGNYSWVRTGEEYCFCFQSRGKNNYILRLEGIVEAYAGWPSNSKGFDAYGYIAGELW